jgi:hypothetical protein
MEPIAGPQTQPARVPNPAPAAGGGAQAPIQPTPGYLTPNEENKVKTSEQEPVPDAQVKSFPNDIKQEYGSLTDGQVKALTAELGPHPTQADMAKVQISATNSQRANETMAQTVATSKQAETDRKAAQATAEEVKNLSRADKSYQFASAQLDKMKVPIDTLVTRLGRLNDTIGQNTPQADALVGPELLTVMAGGAGSGLRMNEAEIARVVGGRSKWQDLEAAINKWRLDPKAARSVTPEQQQQIGALLKTVNDKVVAKQGILDDARQELIASDDPKEHRRIVADANKKLTEIDNPLAQGLSNFHTNKKTGERIGWNGKQWVPAPTQ